MSNHAAVTADGGEIGRAQATQAAACGVDFDRRMNPILLKPTSGRRSHLVVNGEEVSLTDAVGYGPTTNDLKPVVLDAFNSLRQQFDWVVAEGAGGAAEINLLERDLVNLPLAAAAGIRSILVVDIDLGGAYASAYGTIELVPQHLRATIGGVLFNRFRGDPTLLDSGNTEFRRRTGIPILGVLPALEHPPILGVEDSMDITVGPTPRDHSIAERSGGSSRPVRVTAIRLPHLANPSDLDPFAIEPDVSLRWAVRPEDLLGSDLIVIPGSRATVRDLNWLKSTGLANQLISADDTSSVIVGICGGYQMLGRSIDDDVESGEGRVDGLGLLDVDTAFAEPKIVRRSSGTLGNTTLDGYQIRWGRPAGAARPWLTVDGQPEGAITGQATGTGTEPGGMVLGTSLHGVFDSDPFRTRLLSMVAERRQRSYRPSPTTLSEALDAQHDRLADWLEQNADVDRLLSLGAEATEPGEGPGWTTGLSGHR